MQEIGTKRRQGHFAKARLESSGRSLKEIAADLGFADGSRFSHCFKRRTDMSPGAYRANVSRPDGDDLTELRRSFSDWPRGSG
ncbi:helix-turn-helix domain-containing protein [Pacificibacter marinus]|nr:helix-turn-helix domain-containing protein [Pacificibacter marinus]